MQDFATNPSRYIATVEELLVAERLMQAAELLRSSTPRIERTGYDNWDGGTEIWTIHLAIDPADYALLGSARESIEDQLTQRFKATLDPHSTDWYKVSIVPRLVQPGVLPRPNARIRRKARQNIIDGLRIDSVAWTGKLDDVDFLARIYDLAALPSHDSRYAGHCCCFTPAPTVQDQRQSQDAPNLVGVITSSRKPAQIGRCEI